MIEYVGKGLSDKTVKVFHTKESESIYSEITIKNIKWLVVSIYRPQNHSNMKAFFEKMTTCFDMALKKYENCFDIALKKYENCIIVRDFKVDMDKPDSPAYA